MRSVELIGIALVAAAGLSAEEAPPAAQAPDAAVVGHTTSMSPRLGATLTLELSNGERLDIALSRGSIRLNEAVIGSYREVGPLERAWRALLERMSSLATAQAVAALGDFEPAGLDGDELAALREIRRTVSALGRRAQPATAPAVAPVPGAGAAPGVPPAADVEAIRRDAEAAAAVMSARTEQEMARTMEQARAMRQILQRMEPPSGSGVGGVSAVAAGLTNLVAAFVALTFIGVGLLLFAPKQLAAVSDQVFRSFWRSFLAGLFAQPLIVPVFGMMIVGLTLTVVGILVIPFAVLAFIAALLFAVAGGFVAVARAVGEVVERRRSRGGPAGTWAPIKYMLYGLAALLSSWLPGVLLSWIPLLGTTLVVVAAILTWVVATAGFGAALISRAGIRGTIVRRIDAALTDEHYWDDVASLTSGSRWA